jgi:hypothetical protein
LWSNDLNYIDYLVKEQLYLIFYVTWVNLFPFTDGAPFLHINEYGTEALSWFFTISFGESLCLEGTSGSAVESRF